MPLNINLGQILLHLFNFAILSGGLYFLLYKPVKRFMDNRTAQYQAVADETAARLDNAKKMEDEYKGRLEKADAEIAQMRKRAEQDAEKLAEMKAAEGVERKERIIRDAERMGEAIKERLISEARERVVDIGVAAASKIIRDNEQEVAELAENEPQGEVMSIEKARIIDLVVEAAAKIAQDDEEEELA